MRGVELEGPADVSEAAGRPLQVEPGLEGDPIVALGPGGFSTCPSYWSQTASWVSQSGRSWITLTRPRASRKIRASRRWPKRLGWQ